MNVPEPELQLTRDRHDPHPSSFLAKVTLAILLLIMAAALAGVFGRGALSHTAARSPSGRLELRYERFARFGASLRLSVTVTTASGVTPELVISSAYLDAVHVTRIMPAPVRERQVPGGVAYEFAWSGAGPLQVDIDLQPIRRYRVGGALVAGGEQVDWWQFVYP